MKISILAAAAVLSLGAISPVLAQGSRERVVPADQVQTSSPILSGRSVSVQPWEATARAALGVLSSPDSHVKIVRAAHPLSASPYLLGKLRCYLTCPPAVS